MSNDIILSCKKCHEFANVGKVGKIWDYYGIQIANFISRHRECGPVQCWDDYTEPYPMGDGEWRCVESECASPDNIFVNVNNWIHYQWFRLIRSIQEVRNGRR